MPSIDKELNLLMRKLTKILEDVGGPNVESGKKKDAEKDRFIALKSKIMTRLQTTCELLEKMTENGGGMYSSADPKLVIKKNQEIRSNLRSLEDEWKEMDLAYNTEKGKRRSKITKEEMEERRQLLADLKKEITELKTIHQSGVVKSSNIGGAGNSPTFANMASNDDHIKKDGGGGADLRPGQLTEAQAVRIQQIRTRGKEMEEKYLSKIEQHVDGLLDVARNIQEEQRLQSRMIDDTAVRIEEAQTHLENTNKRMKDVLKQVRTADKFCVDIMCILLLLGLASVLYALCKNGSSL